MSTACTSFTSCVPNPISGTSASTTFSTLKGTMIYSMNFTLYIVYAFLIFWVVYSLFKGVYSLFGATDETDSYERLRGAITNAVFASIGIVLIFSMRFFFATALQIAGVPDAENIFLDPLFNIIF